MNISVPVTVNIIIWILSADAALLVGLSLIGEKVDIIIERVSISALLLFILYYPLHLYFNNTYFVLLAFLILIPILKILLKRTYVSISIAVLLAVTLKLTIDILVAEVISIISIKNAYNIMITQSALTISIYLLLGTIVLWRNIQLCPKDWELYSIGDTDQKKNYSRSISVIILMLVIMAVWLLYIDNNLKSFKFNQQILVFSFTFVF